MPDNFHFDKGWDSPNVQDFHRRQAQEPDWAENQVLAPPVHQPPLAIPNEIPTPEAMQNVSAHMRMNWKVNDIVSKVVHKLFLAVTAEDVIVLYGEQYDHSAMQAAAQAISAAGWLTAVLQKHELDGKVAMVVCTTPAGLARVGVQMEVKENLSNGGENGQLLSQTGEATNQEPGTKGAAPGADEDAARAPGGN